jgi:sugar phosphate isomerase/epimerase
MDNPIFAIAGSRSGGVDQGPGPADRRADSLPPARIDRVGIQLYTLRSEMERDVERTLSRVAGIGYREVEFAGYFGRSPVQLREALRAAGLDAPSAHVEAKTVEGDWMRTLDEAAAVGHQYIVAAWIDADRRMTLDDWKRWAGRFGTAAEQAKSAGLRFAYHNHDYEFTPVGGRIPYDVLLENTDPDLVAFEMDLFWLIRAGSDPLAYFARHPGRFPLVHVKDMDASPEKRMVDVGRGSIDFRRIFARSAEAGIRHYFVEHDEPVSPFESARISFEAMRRLEIPASPSDRSAAHGGTLRVDTGAA